MVKVGQFNVLIVADAATWMGIRSTRDPTGVALIAS